MSRFIFILYFFFSAGLMAQTRNLSGKVTDAATPLAGATVKIKGTDRATLTDTRGDFTFTNIPAGSLTLSVTFVGYEAQEVRVGSNENSVTIVMTEKAETMDEFIVTGVFDKRKKIEASIAITTLDATQLERQVPSSAADLLKNVPGVFVNSSLGEIRNSVASRGITIGTQDGSFGYEYVSMQEDGLPVTNTTYFSYGPDFFLRPDATLGRLEAVRGGPASITAANAPGGIFNYVSKTGGSTHTAEVRARVGIQGRKNNPYYRTDVNLGGPLGKNWFYNVGGFYRYDMGGRYAGYPMNNGGQVKGNLVKKYNKGSVKLFLKMLNDRNGYIYPTPTVNYDHPQPAEGFDISSSLLIPDVQFKSVDFLNLAGGSIDFDAKDLVKNKYNSVGLNWEHDLGKGWSISNAARYSDNSTNYNTSGALTFASGTDIVTYFLLGGQASLGVGTYSFKDIKTGEELLSVNSAVGATGVGLVATKNNLPNQQLGNNFFLAIPLNYYGNTVNEFLDQVMINKKLKNMSFTAGAYYGYSDASRYSGIPGVALATAEDMPRLMSLTFTGGTLGGTMGVHALTDNNGIGQANGDNGTFLSFNGTQKQLAFFLGHNWQVNPKLTLDWGLRYENVNVSGYNIRSYMKPGVHGGADGDPLTFYDYNLLESAPEVNFDKTLNSLSYSIALNYQFSNTMALYGRYSQGKKAPDMDVYFAANRPETVALLDPRLRTTEQIEVGYKLNTPKLRLFITPFYSVLSGVPSGQMFQEATGGFYTPPTVFSKYATPGVEIEADYDLTKNFNIRAIATFQKSKIVESEVWVANGPGAEDDTKISYSGNETDNQARAIVRVTPTYTAGKFFANLTWSYLGKRQANSANVFSLPAFSQFDFLAGYGVTKNLDLSLMVSNIFNTYGAMSWQRPGGILQALEGNQSFDKAQLDAAVAVNAPYGTISIPPRAVYLTAAFRF